MKLVVKGARIVSPSEIAENDILIENGLIKKIAKDIKDPSAKTLDARGKYALPGFIDMHTHLRTPGREDEETIETGSRAAVKGGFTTILCMPNTEPAIDNYEIALRIRKEAEKIGLLDIFPVGAITKQRQGKELSEFGQLKKAGCLALSDDGSPVEDPSLLRKALEYAKLFDLLIISHCEDLSLSGGGILRESELTAKSGFSYIPEIAESVIVAREIELARFLEAKIHLAHISTNRSIELIKRAKKDAIRVSAESCPHYFSLSLEDIAKNFDSNYKVNPPIGTKEDRQAICKALASDIIDCIATDHAPHTFLEKEGTFYEAAFGMIGLETAFALSLRLVKERIINLEKLADKLSYAPSRILGLSDRGLIEEGRRADIAIVDLDKTWTLTEEKISSKSKNTPFLNQAFEGCVEYTLYKGKIVYKYTDDHIR
ncbi:MAG: dihydroorotase [Candidatus Omnitrophica bacterium]|nr:dihydroorotase [Candidatus Omnitrophota bacterium]